MRAAAPGHAAGVCAGAHDAGVICPGTASVTPVLTPTTHVCMFHRMTALPVRLGPNGPPMVPYARSWRGEYQADRQPGAWQCTR